MTEDTLVTAEPRLPESVPPDASIYLRPTGLLSGAGAARAVVGERALPLGGGSLAFATCEVIIRPSGIARGARLEASTNEIGVWARDQDDPVKSRVRDLLKRLSPPRPPAIACPSGPGLDFDRPRIMAVLNVTPDSFSGDGLSGRPLEAIGKGHRMAREGADIIDVGGESTRPGAQAVTVEEELERVIPVIEGLRDCGKPVSIDTRNPTVMKAAVSAGATILNDVSALTHDPESLSVAAALGAPVVLMHAQGRPDTMNRNPRYGDVLCDVFDYLERRVRVAIQAGIRRDGLIVDPGIGFGKTAAHNLALVKGLAIFQGLGCPVMLGVSRKLFVAGARGSGETREGLSGSLAAALWGLARGANILRVHDVDETVRATTVWMSIMNGDYGHHMSDTYH